MSFENRPVIVSKLDTPVVHTINYKNHKEFCKCFDPVDVIKKFFNVFIKRFVLIGKKLKVKYTFSIINFQPASTEGITELTNSRIWSTICVS